MDYYTLVIHTVIGILAATIRNPQSERAQRLRVVVQELVDAGQEFLDMTATKAKR